MEKQSGVMETSFWVLGHRVDVLSYLFRFFTIFVPDAVCIEVLASDPRYPQRVYGYQEMFRLLQNQGLLTFFLLFLLIKLFFLKEKFGYPAQPY